MQTRVIIMGFVSVFTASIFMLPQASHAQESLALDATAACAKALSDDPELVRLKDKVGLSGVAEQTFEMKTNKAYPNAFEKKVIALWVGKVRNCSAIIEKAISDGQFQPAMVPLINGLYPRFEQRALQLFDKKVTYGEFARARDEDQSAFLKAVVDVKHAVDQQQEQERIQAQQEQEKLEQTRIQAQHEQEKLEQTRMQAQQEQSRNEANERARRCQIASQNAASFCKHGNNGVVVNVGPGANSQNRDFGSQSGMDAFNCTDWTIKADRACQ